MRKAIISCVMSVCPSVRSFAWNNSAPAAWIFMRFDIWIFFDHLSRKPKFYRNLTGITFGLHEYLWTFMVISDWILVRVRNTGLCEMIVGVLTTCHTQYTSDSSIYVFYLKQQYSKFLLHTLQVLYMCTLCDSTGLFEMIVGVLTTCHTQYTWDSSICVFFI